MSTTPSKNSEVAEEVKEVVGRMTAMMVNYPELQPRFDKTIEFLNRLLIDPQPGLMQYVINDLQTLWAQLHRVYEKFPELRKELRPIIDRLEGLLAID